MNPIGGAPIFSQVTGCVRTGSECSSPGGIGIYASLIMLRAQTILTGITDFFRGLGFRRRGGPSALGPWHRTRPEANAPPRLQPGTL